MMTVLETLPGPRTLRRDMRTVCLEGVAFSVMVGSGESYLPAFVLALGLGEVASGLVVTWPLLAGGVLQLFAPLGIGLAGSHRRWAAACAAVQAGVFIPLVLGAVHGSMSGVLVFAVATMYWAAGMAVGPAWNVWVERLIPAAVRRRFFAGRTGLTNLGILLGLLLGGAILERFRSGGHPLLGFALLFAVAGAARFVSAGLLARQRLPSRLPPPDRPRQAIDLMVHMPNRPGGALLVYMLALTTTVSIASPFFTAYMLRHLHMSYTSYTAILITALLAKAVAVPVIGLFASRLELKWLLRAAWFGIALLPALWLLSDSFSYLIGLQLLGGIVWGAHEYVTFLLLFEMIDARERAPLLTAYNFGHACAAAAGSLLGGIAFSAIGVGLTAYVVVFGFSSLARFACLWALVRIPGAPVPALPLFFRAVAVRPATGPVLRPILATLRQRGGRRDDKGGKR